MNRYLPLTITSSLLLFLLLAVPALSLPGFGGIPIPDPDDITDIIDDVTDIDFIIGNLAAYGLGTDQGDPITTCLDDAVTEVPFLDNYPYAPLATGENFLPCCRLPRGGDGYRMVMPGRYTGTFETFCLNAGTSGPGHGDGYLYAPLKGPWAHIIQGILKTSEVHPEITQHEVQYLIWSVLSRTSLSDMSPEMQGVARVLMTPENIGEINASAFEIIPFDQMDSVFSYLDMPPELEQISRAQSEIRSLATGGGSFEELEALAVLPGDPLRNENDREIPEVRWSYHPDGYFIRYYPHGYSSTDYEIAMPDKITIEVTNRESISSIEDEHGNRIEINGDTAIFSFWDPDNPRRILTFDINLRQHQSTVTNSWINQHRSEVRKLVGDSEWVDYIVELGKFAKSIEPQTPGTKNTDDPVFHMMDLACEAWMYAVIAVYSQTEKDAEVKAGGAGLPDYDWRDSYRPLDPTDDTATPGDRGRQRLGGRDPRPSQDPDWGTAENIPEYKPDKNPPAHSAREGMDKFNSYNDTMGWFQNGVTGNVVNMVGFAIPNAVFGGLMEFTLTLWDNCIAATNMDPPRSDYDELASPDNFTFTPLVSPDDGPPDRVAALNSFLKESQDALGYMTAAVISVDRHGGAVLDGDSYWAYEQAKNLVYLQREAGWETYEAADALDNLIDELKSEGFDDAYVTADDIRDSQERLRNEGFTSEQLAAAEYLELTDSMLESWKEYLLSIDPDEGEGSVMEAAENLSAALRGYANYLVNLPDVHEEDIGAIDWPSVSP